MASIRFALTDSIGPHHMALYRSWINGLDLSEMGQRYIEEPDVRRVRQVLQALRTRFVQAAYRAQLPRYARLLGTRLRQPSSEAAQAGAVADLEQFRDQIDPDGVYSEAELVELYQQSYPGGENTAALRRRQRWIEQQNEALFWIERFLVSKPMPGDPLPAWLEGSAVDRLQAQGIQTLQQLKDFIERHGKTWYRHIEGVGPVVADRIVQWLLEHTHDLGHLGDTAVVGRNVVARSGLPSVAQRLLRRQDAPAVPATLQEAAQQQLPACLIRARDDWHTIQAWIQARAGSAHTARAYRKEAERFLLFLQQEKGCGLRQLKTEDLNDYKTFLALLGRGAAWPFRVPEHQYLAPRNIARADARWRPFEGALSARSAQHALVIVRAWLEFLVQVRYLPANPAAGINIRAAADDQRTQVRGLSRAQYDLVRECAQRYADDHEGDRLRFLLALAYHSAARLSELAQANFADLSLLQKEHEPGSYLMLGLRGKGNKIRNVWLPDEVQRAWMDYARHRGLDVRMSALKGQDIAMLADSRGRALGASRLYKILKTLFERAAQMACERGWWDDAAIIAQCSPHDLRHSRARHLGQSRLALPILQRMLGHASLATTSLYTTSSDLEMAQALEALQQG